MVNMINYVDKESLNLEELHDCMWLVLQLKAIKVMYSGKALNTYA